MILVIPSTDRTKAIRIKKRDFINNKKGEREVIIVTRWVFKWMSNISVEIHVVQKLWYFMREGFFRLLIRFHKGQNKLTQSLKNRKQDLGCIVWAFCKVDTTCCDGIYSDLVSFDFSSVLWGAIFYSLAFWSKCLWYSAL